MNLILILKIQQNHQINFILTIIAIIITMMEFIPNHQTAIKIIKKNQKFLIIHLYSINQQNQIILCLKKIISIFLIIII